MLAVCNQFLGCFKVSGSWTLRWNLCCSCCIVLISLVPQILIICNLILSTREVHVFSRVVLCYLFISDFAWIWIKQSRFHLRRLDHHWFIVIRWEIIAISICESFTVRYWTLDILLRLQVLLLIVEVIQGKSSSTVNLMVVHLIIHLTV